MIHDDAAALLVAGAVLDDLAPDELAGYEAHRGACAECRGLELDLDHVLTDLALVVPERIPPPGLLAAVMITLEAGGGATGEPAPQVAFGKR